MPARVINIKVGRVRAATATACGSTTYAQAFAVPVWCGGMLESGIGRAHNIHLSTLPNFTKPGDTSSASRYFTPRHRRGEAGNRGMVSDAGAAGRGHRRDARPRLP
jgi:L-alanine-DL-glutamate epimerase-like enolase superfamily enzyme